MKRCLQRHSEADGRILGELMAGNPSEKVMTRNWPPKAIAWRKHHGGRAGHHYSTSITWWISSIARGRGARGARVGTEGKLGDRPRKGAGWSAGLRHGRERDPQYAQVAGGDRGMWQAGEILNGQPSVKRHGA